MAILSHYFKLGLKATYGTCSIWQKETNETILDYIAQNWCKCFKIGDLLLETKYWVDDP